MTNRGEYDEHTTVRHYYQYFPPGVKRVIKSGSSAWIGEVDDSTVLKYPLAAGEGLELLEAERKILEAIPPHKNVLGFKGSADAGIYLERAPNGTVAEYILNSGKPLSLQQRLAWCRETAEAVAWIHAHRVLHCDIQPTNLLLDKDLHVKLSDFQGKLLAEDGTVLVDGCSMEPYRFSLPRDDFRADVKTDLFALGCTVYFILLGHTIFPDIGDWDEEAWEKVEERLAKKEWPREQQVCSAVTVKCWEQQYESTEEVVWDLEAIEREHGGVSTASMPDWGLGELAGAGDNRPADGPQ
ncbi:kinase-like domain-containing protein [Podospora appendiculata]|uniref:Kinase-like domain-containing protein n=1 Tax=Podospora appendiculata TaxID=314037 RepID=A0AAE0XLY7_9PEZI|nr:kinase-like domain-containing protein [Podospora appendiculata]